MAAKKKKQYIPRFDWKGFFLLCGVGFGLVGFGYFLFWAISTAPENSEPSEILGFRPLLRFVREIPVEISEKIAYTLAVLFMLFGGFLVVNAFYRGFLFIVRKFRKNSK